MKYKLEDLPLDPPVSLVGEVQPGEVQVGGFTLDPPVSLVGEVQPGEVQVGGFTLDPPVSLVGEVQAGRSASWRIYLGSTSLLGWRSAR
ncbi:hypothetical protein BASA81_012753 [Batrachochytrium salamandrivorans]|nr:hypothetical protein BASA81_012753 [Batrachochytrium salamandrivorans]